MSLQEHIPEGVSQSPENTLLVMMYELGYVAHGLVYGMRRPSMREEHYAESRINLADLMTQCRLLAEQMGWSEEELRADGEERFKERMQEVALWQRQPAA